MGEGKMSKKTKEQKIAKLKKKLAKIEETEFDYPIYKRSKRTGIVVKFTGLNTGEVVVGDAFHALGKKTNNWALHTNLNIWQDFDPYELNKPQDKDLVWCWSVPECSREARFYDAKNNCSFTAYGTRPGIGWTNYEVIPKSIWQDESKEEWAWAREAFKKLED